MPRPAKFLKSAVRPKDYPAPDKPEVALMGRSNAGKSSLLNALCNQKAAMVSQSPGKTRLLNFFDFGDRYRFVDMPGYGYASRSSNEILGWQEMITTYLEVRENLKGVVLIMDARRDWEVEEEWIREWCQKLDLPLMLVLNKADKFPRRESLNALEKMRAKIQGVPIHLVSSLKKTGIEELEDAIFEKLVQGKYQ